MKTKSACKIRTEKKVEKKTIEKKSDRKIEFQKEFGLLPREKTMLLGISVPLTEKNGFDLFLEILPGLEVLNLQIALLGVGSDKFRKIFWEFARENRTEVVILEDCEKNLQKLHAATDAQFFPIFNAETKTQLQESLNFEVVPIAPEKFAKVCQNYDPNLESGNSFLFADENPFAAFASLVRATEVFRFPFDWKNIARAARG